MKDTLKRGGACLLACAAAMAHQSVHAAAYSSADLGPITYKLVDLNEADGLAPQITPTSGTLTLSHSVSTSDGVILGGTPNVVATHTETQTYNLPFGAAQSLDFEGYRTSSGANGLSAKADVPVGGQWTQRAQYDVNFVLAPKTAVEITAAAKVALGVQVPAGSVVVDPSGVPLNGYFDWAPLQAGSVAALYAGDHLTDPFANLLPECRHGCEAADLTFTSDRTYSTVDRHEAKDLKIVLSNDSDVAVTKHFIAVAYQSGYATAPLSMVPEPSTWAQAWWGLLCMGVFARRYRGRARQIGQA